MPPQAQDLDRRRPADTLMQDTDEGQEEQMDYRVNAGPNNDDIPALQVLNQPHHWEIEHRDGVEEFTGRLIGYGSSRRHEHRASAHDTGFARCPACRWSELWIFMPDIPTTSSRPLYLVLTLGPSIIKGENTRCRIEYTTSPYELVELCTVRRGDGVDPYLPASNARALAQAASYDHGIKDAYVNRAVA